MSLVILHPNTKINVCQAPSPTSTRTYPSPTSCCLAHTGEKETRAWTISAGMTAPQAAGAIHSDFEKGFIRAETIAYDDYIKSNG